MDSYHVLLNFRNAVENSFGTINTFSYASVTNTRSTEASPLTALLRPLREKFERRVWVRHATVGQPVLEVGFEPIPEDRRCARIAPASVMARERRW
jgi:hypothetical protein